jgi:electron transfer flavoprotein alpha subunit
VKHVALVCEHRRGQLRGVTDELIGAAHQIIQGEGTVTALLLCDDAAGLEPALRAKTNRLVVVEDSRFADFEASAYAEALETLIQQEEPDIVLGAHSAFGMDLFPGLAASLDRPLATDVVAIERRDGELVAVREVYGGKLRSEVRVAGEGGPAMVTVRAGSYQAAEGSLAADVVTAEVELAADRRRRFLRYIKPEAGDVDISQADVVLGIGRGVRDEDNVAVVKELAGMLGGVLAGSRPVIDAGWLPKDRQVGQSGKTVKPKLYLALGISGAFQHVAGIRGSDLIVAVNKDPEAPIFEVAHYGIVADMMTVVTSLKEQLAES